MISLRRSAERGHFNYGWLDTFHTFSFADYVDARHMGFRALRVINEDRVLPGEGFPTHGHRDMEIVTYILEGALEHKDSMGNGSVIRPGDVQRMSAGSGVTHSEYNPSEKESVHLLQIWILPERQGLKPGYEQRHFSAAERKNRLRLVVSPLAEEGAVKVHQNARIYAGLLDAGVSAAHPIGKGRFVWLQLARGSVEVNGKSLHAGDGAAFENEEKVFFKALQPSELLLFDLA